MTTNNGTHIRLALGDGYPKSPGSSALAPLIKVVQRKLGVDPDGRFGPKTEAAVRRFQTANRITGDTPGVIGPQTWNALTKAAEALPSSIAQRIVSLAEADLGEMEKPGNSGFKNALLESDMKRRGWRKGLPWCDFWVKRIWMLAYHDRPDIQRELERLITGGTLRSFRNFKNSGLFVVSPTPALGAICYEKHSVTTGHAMIVAAARVGDHRFQHISGNTNSGGSREGNIVAKKWGETTHKRILGFVHPIEV